MQFSFRHAALIASVLLGVIATVSLTLYLNGGGKGKPPSAAQSLPQWRDRSRSEAGHHKIIIRTV